MILKVIPNVYSAIPDFGVSMAFPQIFTVSGVSWTLDPSMEAANHETKLANNKFIHSQSSQVLTLNQLDQNV